MSTFVTQQDRANRIAQEQYKKDCKKALEEIYRAHATLVRCAATDKMIVELLNRYMAAEVVPNLALFNLALSENPEEFQQALSTLAVETQKSRLIEEIIHLLRTGGSYSEEMLKAERKNKLAFFDKQQLLARRNDILDSQRLNKIPVAELKAQVKAARTHDREVLPPDYTAEKLRHHTSSRELKFLIQRYSLATVNDRLAGRS